MSKKYVMGRVKEPVQVLPVSAWKLDNSRNIFPNEVRVSIRKLHLEGSGFKQINTEASGNKEIIKQKIVDIVIRRGKLHNPITDTGGLAFGIIEEIGAAFENTRGLKVGDEVVCNISLTSVPAHIDKIKSVDPIFHQVEADGYMLINNCNSLVKVPKGVPVELLMFAFDESGTLMHLHNIAKDKKKFLVVGDNLITNLLYGYVIKRSAPKGSKILCVCDKNSDVDIIGEGIDRLKKEVFESIKKMDILKPLECIDILDADSKFDLTVNCAEIPGAETINILAAKPGGMVVFANLINNLNIALYITESLSKPVQVCGAVGYLEDYDRFDIEIVSEMAPYFEKAKYILNEENSDSRQNDEKKHKEKAANRAVDGMVKLEDFVFSSRAMDAVLEEIMRVSKYDCNVIVFGDTGVGKEKVANLIQKNSDRKMRPFVKINCASISPNLIESEFFGYEKGAFTGANATGKKGYFEIANNGVIFLDEIGELPMEMQAKLLRVIQDGEFYRVGGTVPVKTNVRIISATNRNLEEFVEKGLFRRDLYYRLNVVPIRIPSLKDRSDDIPTLVEHFLDKYGKKYNMEISIEEVAMEYLRQQQWPGNIRELENAVQRLIISSKDGKITLMDVMRDSHGELFDTGISAFVDDNGFDEKKEEVPEMDLQLAVDEYEKGLIKYACEKYGSTRKAAKALGISQTQIVRKKKKYQL